MRGYSDRTRNIGALLGMILLSGCASTVSDLKADHVVKVVQIEGNYQVAYRNIATMARECLTGAAWGAHWGVDGDLYTDIGTGEVTFYSVGPQGRLTGAHAEVRNVDAGTELSIWARNESVGAIFQRWANGYKECQI